MDRFTSTLSCRFLTAASVILLWAAAPADAEQNWPNWRGPHASGVAEGDSYPTKWSTTENIVWKYELPGLGASTPIVWGDYIILTGENGESNSVLCLDRSGQKKWETMLGNRRAAKKREASGANSSPVSDGKHIFVYFKSGDVACLDFDGKVLWRRNLQEEYGEDTLWWDLGTSPVLTKNLVVVAVMQSGSSYIVGIEKESGKNAWKQDRNLDAPNESAQSYTTPIVLTDEKTGSETIIVLGADHVTAHDAATGEQQWIVGNLNPGGNGFWRSVCSPAPADGHVIAPYARGESLTAIRLGGEGDVTDSHVDWTVRCAKADVPSPVVADGKVYICSDNGQIEVREIKDGQTTQTLRLRDHGARGVFKSSPIVAAGHLYATNEGGTTFVVALGDELQFVSQNPLEDFVVATPVFCDGRIYLRTDKYLHCIGEK